MKRQRENIVNQSAAKKPDVSTDFRSKIGAKLKTFLNGFTPERRRFQGNKRHLYADLFEPQHSPIIIDHPTVVIKTERPDNEDGSSSDTTRLDSQNFLLSAKSRINELLNKPQNITNKFKDNEKENNQSNKEHAPTSSSRSNSSLNSTKSHLTNSKNNKKRKISAGKDDSYEPVDKNMHFNDVVIIEDIQNSEKQTKSNPIIPIELDSEDNLDEESNTANPSGFSEQNINIDAGDHLANNASDAFILSDHVECVIDDESPAISQSIIEPEISIEESNHEVLIPETSCNENSLQLNTSTSEISESSGCSIQNDSVIIPSIVPHGDMFLEGINDPIDVDDPLHVNYAVLPKIVPNIENNLVLNESKENTEADIEILCVKKPTHEIITLEDDNDSEDVIEEVHRCVQCGKAFLAKSLLDFHIRMHGSDSSSLPSTSSQSCITIT